MELFKVTNAQDQSDLVIFQYFNYGLLYILCPQGRILFNLH